MASGRPAVRARLGPFVLADVRVVRPAEAVADSCDSSRPSPTMRASPFRGCLRADLPADAQHMLSAIAAKLAVTAVLGFTAGFFGNAGLALDAAQASPPNAGAFGGPVTHVGSIEWDVAAPTTGALHRVSCSSRAAAGTSCYVSG